MQAICIKDGFFEGGGGKFCTRGQIYQANMQHNNVIHIRDDNNSNHYFDYPSQWFIIQEAELCARYNLIMESIVLTTHHEIELPF